MKQVTIIDYGAGNLHSLEKAVEASAGGDFDVKLSNNVEDINNASHIILPGVGAFGSCMSKLNDLPNLKEALLEQVVDKKKPLLGICVGMQMLADVSLEYGEHEGLSLINGKIVPIVPKDNSLKVPHMGWNELEIKKNHPIFSGIEESSDVYFVHSFYFECRDSENVLAKVNYGDDITAVIAEDNIVATQFHPEKSQKVGLKFLANFLKMD